MRSNDQSFDDFFGQAVESLMLFVMLMMMPLAMFMRSVVPVTIPMMSMVPLTVSMRSMVPLTTWAIVVAIVIPAALLVAS